MIRSLILVSLRLVYKCAGRICLGLDSEKPPILQDRVPNAAFTELNDAASQARALACQSTPPLVQEQRAARMSALHDE